MKKIMCLIESLGSGGAERQLTGLAVMLSKDGNEVKVLTYYPKFFYKPELDKADIENIFIENAHNKIHRIFGIAKAIIKYKPDVLIAYSPSVAVLLCVLKRFGCRCKLIVSERNTTQVNDIREKVKFFVYRWADWIVPNSNMQEDFIKRNYPSLTSKIIVITNFVDTDLFSPIQETKNKTNICNIICVGRDNPQKNQLRFLDALKILESKGIEFHVDWFGSFESAYGQQCKEKIIFLELQNYISLKGETSNVRDEYRKHDIFCLPSIYEGFPNVLCEAMSCGLPIVCSNVCDNPNIVRDGVNGLLFNPQNTEEMAIALETMIIMGNSEKETMGTLNRERAVKLFSKEIFLKKYKSLL